MSIRVLIVDDHQIMREGLRSLLSKHADVKLVGEAEDGREALALVRELRPDVVITDIAMPNLNGIDAARHITEEHPGTRVVLLSMHADRNYVVEALSAGASAYLVKDSAFDELAKALRIVVAGGVYLSHSITGVVVEDYLKRLTGVAAQPVTATILSPREREVLQLIAEGKSAKEIADVLHLSTKTVDAYRRQLMAKLSIYNVAGLVKYAIREGFTSVEG